MASKRIYQIATEFGCDEKEIMSFLARRGMGVSNRLSAVSEDTYNFLKRNYKTITLDTLMQSARESPFEYVRIDSGIKIEKYNGSETHLTIPSRIDGLSVISIDNWAFIGCNSLETITLPDTVNLIGQAAFSNCSSLKKIFLPDDLERIDYKAFSGCTNLEFVKIPDSVNSIGNELFEGCTNLKWVYIKKSWRDEAINNIFGVRPHHKIFRTIDELKNYIRENINRVKKSSDFSPKLLEAVKELANLLSENYPDNAMKNIKFDKMN